MKRLDFSLVSFNLIEIQEVLTATTDVTEFTNASDDVVLCNSKTNLWKNVKLMVKDPQWIYFLAIQEAA